MNNFNKKREIFYNIAGPVVIAMFFVIDRLFKKSALFLEFNEYRPIITDILTFRLVFNQNIAFSLPLSGPWLNILISLIIFGLFLTIISSIIRKTLDTKSVWLLTFILFGAISNLLDRFIHGAVVDYLDLKYFTVFNLADVMISIGVIVLVFTNILNSNDKSLHQRSDSNEGDNCCR